jgi:hypothetical protein
MQEYDDLIDPEDVVSIIKGIELIRQTKMKHREDLDTVIGVYIYPGEPNIEVECENGNTFLLSMNYIEDFFNEKHFNKTFGI